MLLSLFLLINFYGYVIAGKYEIEFEKGGNYSVKISRIGGVKEKDSIFCRSVPEVLLRPDMADPHLLFSPLTDYALIYGDSGDVRHDFETQQILEGTVYNTDGRGSVLVTALNCKTGQIFRTYADKEGRFVINVNEFVDSTVFNIDACDNIDRRRKFDLSLTESPLPNIPAPATITHIDNTILYSSFDSARVLRNIEVTARKPQAMNNFKIEPTKGYYDGDPAIYRHNNFSSLLKSLGVYTLKNTTVIMDNQIIQRSTDTEDDYTFDPDIESYLNSINISEIRDVEYIRNDPRTMMFQSFQNGLPVLLIYTKFGSGGPNAPKRPLANSFTPMGYEPNVINRTEENDDSLILWIPEIIIRNGELLNIPINDDLKPGVFVSIYGITDSGELVDCNFVIL